MSANYGWIITKEVLSFGDESEVGIMGPFGLSPGIEQRLKSGEGTKFRLYDDDDELYYEGLYIGDLSEGDPLHDFGAPNAGCTYMDEFANGTWFTVIA